MEKAMRTNWHSPASRADVDDIDLASTDMPPGRVAGAAFASPPGNPSSAGPAPGCAPEGSRKMPLRESRSVKVSLSDAVQIIFATVAETDDPAGA
jgi:hypothetical protein